MSFESRYIVLKDAAETLRVLSDGDKSRTVISASSGRVSVSGPASSAVNTLAEQVRVAAGRDMVVTIGSDGDGYARTDIRPVGDETWEDAWIARDPDFPLEHRLGRRVTEDDYTVWRSRR